MTAQDSRDRALYRASRPRAGRFKAFALVLLAACGGEPERVPPNVLLVTLDATRADALSSYDPEHGRTPHLDALARESLRFENAVASAPYTGPAHASILTGLYPPQHGLRDYLVQALPEQADTLAEHFQRAGYQTAAFVSAYVLAPRFGLDQGFDAYRYQPRRSAPRPGGAESEGPDDEPAARRAALERMFYQRPADDTVGEALEWLASRDPSRPFFVWIHLYDPHTPWTPPDGVRRPVPAALDEDAPELERRLYYDEVTFADEQIGRLLEALASSEPLVVAVTADHGELLGHHGRRMGGHSPELVEATLRVPLFVRAPGRAPGVVRRPVRALDLFPTLLEAAGLPVPSGIPARSLFSAADEEEPRIAYSETLYEHYPDQAAPGRELVSLRVGRWKLVTRRGAPPGRIELYDLGSDPEEQRNLAEVEPDRLASMRAQLDSLVAGWPERSSGATLDLSDEELREHVESLRALGYVE